MNVEKLVLTELWQSVIYYEAFFFGELPYVFVV